MQYEEAQTEGKQLLGWEGARIRIEDIAMK